MRKCLMGVTVAFAFAALSCSPMRAQEAGQAVGGTVGGRGGRGRDQVETKSRLPLTLTI